MAEDGTVAFFEQLLESMGIKPAAAVMQYAEGLVEAGASLADFEEASLEELGSDYEFKKLHVRKVEAHRAAKRGAGGEGGGAPTAAAPSSPQPHESVTPESAARAGGSGSPGGGGGGSHGGGGGGGYALPDGGSLRVGEVIGRGGSASVHKGKWAEHARSSAKDVAVKMLAAGATERELGKFEKELKTITLASQRCDFVCRVYGAHQHEGQMVLIMKEYVEDLTKMQQRVGAMEVGKALVFAGESKCDEFCIKNEELCIKNEKLCIQNDEFCRSDLPRPRLAAPRAYHCLRCEISEFVLQTRNCVSQNTKRRNFALKMMNSADLKPANILIDENDQVSQNDEFCIKNDEFCIKNALKCRSRSRTSVSRSSKGRGAPPRQPRTQAWAGRLSTRRRSSTWTMLSAVYIHAGA